MRECGECRFCCWSFAVLDIPDELKGIETKQALTHCQHECEGCAIHERDDYPEMCKTFICPYLSGDDIHRPDIFQEVLEQAKGNIGNYIPMIPTTRLIEDAEQLVRDTRSLPAAIMINNEWSYVMLPLDRKADGEWDEVQPWT